MMLVDVGATFVPSHFVAGQKVDVVGTTRMGLLAR